MADLMTHFTFAYALTRFPRFARFRVLLYTGVILPDILSRPFYILKPELYLYTVGIHTPVFMAFFCLLCAEFFPRDIRPDVRKYLMAGVGLHFFVDLFQKHLLSGCLWFFPFSWRSFEIGWYWPHELLRFIPVWILFIASVESVIFIRGHFIKGDNDRF